MSARCSVRMCNLQKWCNQPEVRSTESAYVRYDVTQIHKLLHSDETMVFSDAGYQGADKRPENPDKTVTWQIAMKLSVCKAMKKTRWVG